MAREIEEIVLKTTLDDQASMGAKKLGDNLEKAEKKATLLGDALKLVGSAVIISGLKNLGFNAIKIAGDFERVNNVLISTFKTQGAVAAQMQFITSVSNRLGINILKSAEGYAKLASSTKIAGLSTKDTQEIFEATATAAAALGLSADDVNGVLRAFSQIASKGKVQAEELLQIAERGIPIQAMMADALGISTKRLQDMAQKGELLAVDVLPKLAKAIKATFQDGALKNATSTLAKHERGLNAWQNAQKDAGKELRIVTGTMIEKAIPAWDLWIDVASDAIFELGVLFVGIDQVINANKLVTKTTNKYSDSLDKNVKKLTDEQKAMRENLLLFKEWEKARIMSAESDIVRTQLGLTEKGFRKVKDIVNGVIEAGGSMKDALSFGQDAMDSLNALGQIEKDDLIKSEDVKNAEKIAKEFEKWIGNDFLKSLESGSGVDLSSIGQTGDFAARAAQQNNRGRSTTESALEVGTAEAAKFLSRPLEAQADADKTRKSQLDELIVNTKVAPVIFVRK